MVHPRQDEPAWSPTVLTDSKGSPIIPTVVPPATEFPYQASSKSSSGSLRNSARGVDRAPSSASTSYFDQSHVPPQNTEPTGSNAILPPRSEAPKRVGTAPSDGNRPSLDRRWRTERPKAQPRSSLLGIRRRATGSRPNNNDNAGFSYDFGHVSDTDSSSSSEEEDEGVREERRKKRREENERAKEAKKKGGRRSSNDAPYSRFSIGNDHYKSKGRVSKRDGRLNISLNETVNNGYLAKALGTSLRHHLNLHPHEQADEELDTVEEQDEARFERPGLEGRATTASLAPSTYGNVKPPTLNIVIMVIGSRGDIQPFLKVGKVLKEQYGHRVRIATHPAFKKFVEKDSGLDFFSVGGDPSELMAFMVKNPGLIPSMETVRAGEIGKRRAAMYEMFQGMWRACINATDDEHDKENMKMMGDKHPFVADAIIANPPSFAHIHIAERLGIPLHMMFTFPYTPTSQFPHPLANIKSSNVDRNYANFMTYPLVEMMTWQGLGDLVNKFRVKSLGLEPLTGLWAPGQMYRLGVPYTYMWSPTLVPKPKDWGPQIDIGGFVFLELASNFKPPKDLAEFLDASEEPPVYIGFGSIVVDDPGRFTKLIFSAVKMAGVRALVSEGWGGLGDKENTPDNIYMLENTPHDWLFLRVSAVIHHGGAGTTAIGLKCGRPTMIVPFFGDQPFWGNMVAAAKAGAHECIPYKKLTTERLTEGIKQCLTDEARENAGKIAKSIEKEGDGAENAVRSFHRSLPLRGEHSMRCSVLEDRVAVWQLKDTHLRLSALAAELLVERKKIKWHDLKLIRHYEWNDFEGPGEPITGGGAAIVNSFVGVAKGVGMVPVKMIKHIKKREAHYEKKKRHEEKKRKRQQQKEAAMKKGENFMSPSQNREQVNDGMNGNAKTQNDGLGSPNSQPNNLSRPARPQPGRGDTVATTTSAMSADPEELLVEEIAEDVGHGFLKSGAALARAPIDLSLAIAQGFHNAPRLYGDKTVRRPIRISGIHSGLRAAGNEFRYGIYDGWTGVVMQPYHGAREGGALGLVSGVGKGIGGFVLKDIAAIIGPIAYTLKGVQKEITKSKQPTNFIRKARIIEGQNDLRQLSEEDKARALEVANKGWKVMKEIWAAEERKRNEGPLGRLQAKRERKEMSEHGAFENIEQTDKALEAKEKGLSFDKVFRRHREELKNAQKPRKSAMTEKREDKKGQLENGRQMSRPTEADEKDEEKADEGEEHGEEASSITAVESGDEPNGHVQIAEQHKKMDGGVQRALEQAVMR
ncbi:hypothetical protein B0A49_10443 [Cryomyces minteri]|uniref:Uncharacterized protein n=1 Tax=Cryomyces minteri TaxID=331657 RepID=A0A4V5NEV9_9PEZI|nr:hypothetical protein B0A49_10443 [Cryomyces minteri]